MRSSASMGGQCVGSRASEHCRSRFPRALDVWAGMWRAVSVKCTFCSWQIFHNCNGSTTRTQDEINQLRWALSTYFARDVLPSHHYARATNQVARIVRIDTATYNTHAHPTDSISALGHHAFSSSTILQFMRLSLLLLLVLERHPSFGVVALAPACR